MGFFDLIQGHEGITLSGVRYGFQETTVSSADTLIKQLTSNNASAKNKAFINFLKSGLTFLGSQKGDAIRLDSLLAEDAAEMLVNFRRKTLGDVFAFDYEGAVMKADLSELECKPYAWNPEKIEMYDTYDEMLEANRVQSCMLMGQEIQWKIPLMDVSSDENSGVLAKLAESRGATYSYTVTDPATKKESVLKDRIRWNDKNASLKALDQFADIWKSVEGFYDTSLTINGSDGNKATVNLLGMPSFFSRALAK